MTEEDLRNRVEDALAAYRDAHRDIAPNRVKVGLGKFMRNEAESTASLELFALDDAPKDVLPFVRDRLKKL